MRVSVAHVARSRRYERRPWSPLPNDYNSPEPLRSALDMLASTLGLASVDHVNTLFLQWNDVVGENLATHCEPVRLERGELTIRAVDSQWATELRWMGPLVVERCEIVLGDTSVTKVRIIR